MKFLACVALAALAAATPIPSTNDAKVVAQSPRFQQNPYSHSELMEMLNTRPFGADTDGAYKRDLQFQPVKAKGHANYKPNNKEAAYKKHSPQFLPYSPLVPVILVFEGSFSLIV
ncbi:hypothetical protein ED733_001268 [Metarhizium rileyi]|uniref:Uncharacterized protein n=1 Tax=Metarhizium rileyi (strain RCEF 4871) TaxID=1649241 RepID=A0A5C6G3W3_METRR|nr:hypothetical protein ED733_001268 [Metarhizium rileyi]